MSKSNEKSARNKSNPSNPTPTTPVSVSPDFLKEAWKMLKPSSRKQNPSEDDVLEAIGVMVDDNKKGVEAGKRQGELIKEVERKAREKQHAEDEKEIEKLKAEYEKKLKALKSKPANPDEAGDDADEEHDLSILNEAELEDYEKHAGEAAAALKAASGIYEKARKRKMAARFARYFK